MSEVPRKGEALGLSLLLLLIDHTNTSNNIIHIEIQCMFIIRVILKLVFPLKIVKIPTMN